jgi:hypothetical protein
MAVNLSPFDQKLPAKEVGIADAAEYSPHPPSIGSPSSNKPN